MKLQTLSFATIALLTVCLTGCEKKDKDAISMDEVNKGIITVPGKDGKEYEVVDLGIGVLFATCNIGATSPEQAGSMFAWGEIQTKESYRWINYKWNKENEPSADLTKYANRDSTKLEKADDAASFIMGEDWAIPREADFKKLFTKKNCTSKYCKLNGVGGFLFTSVVKGYEGNSVFFPLSGHMNDDDHKFFEQYGWFWTNSLYTNPENQKLEIKMGSTLSIQHKDGIDSHTVNGVQRCLGLPIRPVFKGEI